MKVVVVMAVVFATTAQAGRNCDVQPPSAWETQQGMALAQTTALRLESSGADVVMLARAGQDLSKYGLAWSHMGFAYRDEAADGSANWRVAHKLNHCGTDSAQVFRQGLGEFYMDQPWRYQAAFVVLSPDAQARLLPLLRDNQRLAQWHTARYSMVAYPWSTRYQQSNQWAIETLAGALDDAASTRPRAQAWLQLHGYEPTTLHINAFTRLGGRLTQANIAFDDHPNAKRFSDRIETVTVDSVFAWLQREALGGPVQVLP